NWAARSSVNGAGGASEGTVWPSCLPSWWSLYSGNANDCIPRADECQEGAGGGVGSRPLPLGGVRIVELADIVAGPSVGAFLGDFGAEVIKIERPGAGDAARCTGGMLDDGSGR